LLATIVRVVLWAVRGRQIELEAFPEGKRHMLFVSEFSGFLADRADISKDQLLMLAQAAREAPTASSG